jgi:hypothetical protein
MRTEAVGQFADSLDRLLAALVDDVDRAELFCKRNAVGITTVARPLAADGTSVPPSNVRSLAQVTAARPGR